MGSYQKQLERAKKRIASVLESGSVAGVQLDISRGHDVKWDEPVNPGWFGIPDGNRKYVVEPATVSIRDWLRLQKKVSGAPSMKRFKRAAYDETVERAKESIEFGTDAIPTPVLEIRADGSIPQEGRSRALGALRAGADYMPIWVAARVYK